MTRRALLQVSLMLLMVSIAFGALRAGAQGPAPELAQGWLPEFTLTARQLIQLAEATPAEKFSWRPAPGVRSIGEVYVHVAIGNLFLLEQAGGKAVDRATVPKDPERAITSKQDVLAWLRKSMDAVQQGYKTIDRTRKVTVFGRETVADHVFLRILVHDNEHLGQSIAYARMNAIVPPWSGTPERASRERRLRGPETPGARQPLAGC